MAKCKNTFHSMVSDSTGSLEISRKEDRESTCDSSRKTSRKDGCQAGRPVSREEQHRHFIGKIYESDFNTESARYPGTIAARIESALRFDKACLALAAARDRREV